MYVLLGSIGNNNDTQWIVCGSSSEREIIHSMEKCKNEATRLWKEYTTYEEEGSLRRRVLDVNKLFKTPPVSGEDSQFRMNEEGPAQYHCQRVERI